MRIARLIALVNLTSWSEHALTTVNSAATIIGLTAAALALLSIGLIFLTGTELGARVRTKADALNPSPAVLFGNGDHRNGNETFVTPSPVDTTHLSQLQTELASAQKAEESGSLRLTELATELKKSRQAGETSAVRVAQLQSELASVHQSQEEKATRFAQLEKTLAETRLSEQTRSSRVAQLEKELAGARRSAEEANAQTKEVELKQGSRRVTPEQRTEFLATARALPTGKVIVSAFFDNRETHDFGAEMLGLLKEAGFDVVERAPVNFFTTSRPSSGIRIGCQDMNNPPPHFATVRKILATLGLDAPDTTVVNADEPDVVEIQITPRQ